MEKYTTRSSGIFKTTKKRQGSINAGIAQLVEQGFCKAQVGGSSPLPGSSFVEKDTEDPRASDAQNNEYGQHILGRAVC